MSSCRAGALEKYDITDGVQYVDSDEAHTFLWLLSRNRSTLDIGFLGYIGIV